MNAFAKMSVLAMFLGMVMTGSSAKADFNNDAVEFAAASVEVTAKNFANQLRNIGLNRVQQLFFRQRLNAMIENMAEVRELSGQPDNQVEDQILDLAVETRNLALQMVNRAEDIDAGLAQEFELLVDLSEDLVDLVD